MPSDREIQLEKENAELRSKLNLAELKIDALARRIFGQKSEKGYPGQLELFAGQQQDPPGKPEPPTKAAPHQKARTRKKPRRPRLPEDLPIEETIIEPPEVLADPSAWRRIGQRHSDRIDYTPGKFFIQRTVLTTYVSKADKEAAPMSSGSKRRRAG